MTTKSGLYYVYLLIVIYMCNIIVSNNETFMVFGGADKTELVCQNHNQSEHGNRSINNTLDQSLNQTNSCSKWPFESLVHQYELKKSEKWIISLITSSQYTGAIFGSLAGGYIADAYGRKLNTMAFFAGNILFGFLSAFTDSIWILMVACRFCIGISNGGYSASSCVLLMESIPEGLRLKAQFCSDIVNSVALIWLALLAYMIQEWQLLSIVSSLQGLPALFMFIFVQESPLWLSRTGKTLEAKKSIIKTILKVNGWWKKPEASKVNEALLGQDASSGENYDSFHESCMEENTNNHNNEKAISRNSYKELFSSKQLGLYTVTVVYSMFITGLAGYLIIYNAGNLVGNIYLNFALLGVVNIVAGILIMIVERFIKMGRRVLQQIGLIGVTVSLLAIVILYLTQAQNNIPFLLVASALIGSMFSFVLWPVNTLFSGQIFPTNLRNKSSGLALLGSRVGGVLAPIVLYLFDIWKPLPFLITLVLTALNSVLAFFVLPEPGETLFEVEDERRLKTHETN